ncbi:CATRA system-associated protein [Streptomyces olivaceoviridis]|uniref:CATRA system-associated protein n=1 Tax=Streptomyces olivaceoviridis TaxID=1921 RepID=UPI0036843E79
MSDWPDALEEARFLLGAVSENALAEPAVWARLELTLADLESALACGDSDRLRLALHALEDSLAGDRIRMIGGPDAPTPPPPPPPPPLADRLDRLVTRIRVAGARNTGESDSSRSNNPTSSAGSASSSNDDAT